MQIVLRMKGDMRMNILNDILEKEGDNRGFVYLYYLEDSWKAFGYSAFCLSLLYPGMKIVKCDNPDIICLSLIHI